jgi:ADP-dependent NAD(P)H-hydrate dehydratase / NAD(P)H-hydrate epimerase
MIKVLNAEQIRQCDSYTIDNEPVKSIDLMERAAKKCYDIIKRRLRSGQLVHVFCGPGNNGGDGLAISRMLGGTGHKVKAWIIPSENASEDFRINEKRLQPVRNVNMAELTEGQPLPHISPEDLVIDAVFGSGLSRPVDGFFAKVINHVNSSKAVVVAIDIPSGLFAEDNSANNPQNIIKATQTLTFQVPKLSFLFAENEQFTGHWQVLDIKLHPKAIEDASTNYFMTEASDIRSFYKPRSKFSHKGLYGHCLVLAGSYGKTGAAVLTAKAALRTGAGLVTVNAPVCSHNIIQSVVPEAMYIADEQHNFISSIPDISKYNAIAAGPGLGLEKPTQNAVKLLIQQSKKPLVLDADALNILAENKTWLAFLPQNTIITPHPGEFQRLVGKSSNSFEQLQMAKEFAFRFQVILVLKGTYTSVITPGGRVYFNTTGNPGMASGGSGDVLTGIILGWLSQGYSAFESALAAVYIHGLAADLAASRRGYEGLIAGDIIENLPKAIKRTFLY